MRHVTCSPILRFSMMLNYTAVTPVHNEERLLPNLIGSMVAQTLTPACWTVIDDGSSDATGAILDDAARRYVWIEALHRDLRKDRAAGGEAAVHEMLRQRPLGKVQFLFRVDADVTLEPNHAETLLAEFARHESLGIVSGTLYERDRCGSWTPISQPKFQPTGAARMYSGACLQAIGGLEGGLGWDTVDVTRALMKGFATRGLSDPKIYHHRPMGSATGLWRGRLRMGEAAYSAGYSPLFMLARSLRRSVDRPRPIAGALMMAGYLYCWLRRQPKLAEPELIEFVRRHQLKRLLFKESVWN